VPPSLVQLLNHLLAGTGFPIPWAVITVLFRQYLLGSHLSGCGSQVHSAPAPASAHTCPDSLCPAGNLLVLIFAFWLFSCGKDYRGVELWLSTLAGGCAALGAGLALSEQGPAFWTGGRGELLGCGPRGWLLAPSHGDKQDGEQQADNHDDAEAHSDLV